MQLSHGIHLAYCTNIHRGEDWAQTFTALQTHTMAVRERVSPDRPYAIGLRLSDRAARELSDRAVLLEFQRWLERNNSYVFTINGFPFGTFHGTRVKERVYTPDWTTRERLEYTNRLFDLLAALLPPGVEGSVSTVPGSFKEFITSQPQVAAMRQNLWECVEHVARVSERTGKGLHLGLEPEPLCFLETSAETVAFLEQMSADRKGDERLSRHLGVNYDACHLAVEFEEPADAVRRFREHGVKLSKLHLSSALKVHPGAETLEALKRFSDETYFHQVIAQAGDDPVRRYRDLPDALRDARNQRPGEEWRIHFHIPLHSSPTKLFASTSDHLLGLLDILAKDPQLCAHLEMETYTWEVMPPELKNRSVVEQLVSEYDWTLAALSQRGICRV